MATQERNVYAGLAVVIGGLMHARPRFFAKVMGELLFWVGEDKMLFGADYAIWEPKWQVEGFVDWDYPDDTFSDYPRRSRPRQEEDPRAQRREAVRRRGARGAAACPTTDAGGAGGRAAGRGLVTTARDVLDALGTVYDPELDEPITALRFVSLLRGGGRGRRRRPAAAADAAVRAQLRLPDGGRRARRGAPAAGGAARSRSCSRTTTRATEINAAVGARRGLRGRVPGRDRRASSDALRELFQRKALVARQSRLLEPRCGADPGGRRRAGRAPRARRRPLPRAAPRARHRRVRRRAGVRAAATGRRCAPSRSRGSPAWRR